MCIINTLENKKLLKKLRMNSVLFLEPKMIYGRFYVRYKMMHTHMFIITYTHMYILISGTSFLSLQFKILKYKVFRLNMLGVHAKFCFVIFVRKNMLS